MKNTYPHQDQGERTPPKEHDTLSPLFEDVSEAMLPTRHGIFRVLAFKTKDQREHLALIHGDVLLAANVPVRLHSECLTGDVFGSLRCDCREQLEIALETLPRLPKGIILYMRQEGRGIGLTNKIKAYALQEKGLDTVEANIHLGFDDDIRSYEAAAEMLHFLGVSSIDLYTNNLKKVEGLRSHGIDISKRTPILTSPNPHNFRYLKTKKNKSGHLLTQLT